MSFDEVKSILDMDLSSIDDELEMLYDEMERYAEVSQVLKGAGREEDSEYFKELAVDRYHSFVYVMQLKKEDEDYDL